MWTHLVSSESHNHPNWRCNGIFKVVYSTVVLQYNQCVELQVIVAAPCDQSLSVYMWFGQKWMENDWCVEALQPLYLCLLSSLSDLLFFKFMIYQIVYRETFACGPGLRRKKFALGSTAHVVETY